MDILIAFLILVGVVGFVLWLISMFFGEALNWALKSIRVGPRTPASKPFSRAVVVRAFTSSSGSEEYLGKVEYKGAIWDASCAADLASDVDVGAEVKVSEGRGMTLKVTGKHEA